MSTDTYLPRFAAAYRPELADTYYPSKDAIVVAADAFTDKNHPNYREGYGDVFTPAPRKISKRAETPDTGKHVAESVAPVAIQTIEADTDIWRERAILAPSMLKKNLASFADLNVDYRGELIAAMVKFGQWARLAISLKVVATAGVIKWTVDPDNFCRFSCPSITRPETGLHHHVEFNPDTGEWTCDCNYSENSSAPAFCTHIRRAQLDCLPGIKAEIAARIAATAVGSMAAHLTRCANDRGLLTPERDF